MEKVLMYTDMPAYNQRIREYNKQIEGLQPIVEAYAVLNIGELTTDELKQLFNNPKDFVFKKMTGGEPVLIGGLKVKSDKAFDMLHHPVGFDELEALITDYKDKCKTWTTSLHYCTIEDGNVVLCENIKKKELEAVRIYAETEDAKKYYILVTTLCEKAKELFGENTMKYRSALLSIQNNPLFHINPIPGGETLFFIHYFKIKTFGLAHNGY